jgi:hypothetical protein
MSLNITPLKVKAVIDPRLEIQTSKDYIATKGAMVNAWQQFPATNVSNSSIQITCNPPNRDIAIARIVFKKIVYQWSISGVNTSGGTLLNTGYVAPRAMPITSTTAAETITINNDTLTQAPIQQYWRSLLHFRNDFFERFGVMSLAPSMLDQFQDYADGSGSVRNPLAAYGDNSFENTRGGYSGFTIDPQVAGNITATGTLTSFEPIFVSPFCWGDKANFYASFAGIQNMSYTCTFSNLARILSITQGQGAPVGQIVLGDPSVNVQSASLFFNYLTPDPIMPISRNLELSYYSVISYPTRSNTVVAAGASIQIPFQSIQVTSIPKRIYIFAKKDDASETAFTSDSYMSLNSSVNPLSITWNNNQFLSQATTQDLYNISVKNGSSMSYSQFTKFTGSVLALDFGTDIGLLSNQSAGVIGNYQLGLTCNFTNTSSSAYQPTMYVVVVSEGSFNITDGSCSHMLGVLSPNDVLNAELLPKGSYSRSTDVYGGKFERLKGFFKKAHDFVKEHKLASRGLALLPMPAAQEASKIAAMLGYGSSGGGVMDYGGNLPTKKTSKKLPKSGNVSLSDFA